MRNPGPEKDRLNRLIGGQPSNKPMADKMTTFSFDHSQQMAIAPNSPFATGSDQGAALAGGRMSMRTLNASGRDAGALTGVRNGMSPDTRGKTNFSGQGTKKQMETYITQGKR